MPFLALLTGKQGGGVMGGFGELMGEIKGLNSLLTLGASTASFNLLTVRERAIRRDILGVGLLKNYEVDKLVLFFLFVCCANGVISQLAMIH